MHRIYLREGRVPRLAAVAASLFLVAALGQAADLAVYYPDGPQDPSQMVAAFAPLRAVARDSQKLDLNGHYFVQLADFQKFVDSSRPAFVLVDAVYVLANREALGLEPLA